MNFSQGHSGTKVRYVNRACFPKEKTPEFTKKGKIHELFVFGPFFGLVCWGDSWLRLENENSAQSSSDRSFWNPLGSWTSAPSSGHGYPRPAILVWDIRANDPRMSAGCPSQNFLFGLIFLVLDRCLESRFAVRSDNSNRHRFAAISNRTI